MLRKRCTIDVLNISTRKSTAVFVYVYHHEMINGSVSGVQDLLQRKAGYLNGKA